MRKYIIAENVKKDNYFYFLPNGKHRLTDSIHFCSTFTSAEDAQKHNKSVRGIVCEIVTTTEILAHNELPKNKQMRDAAEEWTFDINGMKWSNNDGTAGDNYASFIAGAKWSLTNRD